jgi:hypothetical protein
MSACGAREVPTVSPDDIATIVVATQRAAPTVTPSPIVSPTPTVTPTLTSTPVPGTPAAPVRISLAKGASSAVIDRSIGAGETQFYVVRGAQAQPMLLDLNSAAGDATVFMMSQGGMYFLRPGVGTAWRGSLPQAGDYYLGVYGGSAPTDYTLRLRLVTRIKFKEGKTQVTVSGKTPDGAVATYSLFSIKGQKVSVTLSGPGKKAALGVTGFIDDKPYLPSSEKKNELKFIAPVTQDYLIEVVPIPGATIGFILDVSFE